MFDERVWFCFIQNNKSKLIYKTDKIEKAPSKVELQKRATKGEWKGQANGEKRAKAPLYFNIMNIGAFNTNRLVSTISHSAATQQIILGHVPEI